MLALTAGLAPGCYSSGGDDEDAGRDGDALADGDAPVDFAETPGDVPAEGDTRAGPWPVLFRLRFVSDIPESVWVAEWVPPYPAGHWLTIHRGGVALAKEPACDVCNCDACPGCSLCGEPCKNGTELPNGGSVEYLWSGVEYPQVVCPTDPSAVCQQPATSGPVGPYSAQFCWGTVMTGSGCAVIVGDLECADVPFTLPDPDGLVEYTIDRGG